MLTATETNDLNAFAEKIAALVVQKLTGSSSQHDLNKIASLPVAEQKAYWKQHRLAQRGKRG